MSLTDVHLQMQYVVTNKHYIHLEQHRYKQNVQFIQTKSSHQQVYLITILTVLLQKCYQKPTDTSELHRN